MTFREEVRRGAKAFAVVVLLLLSNAETRAADRPAWADRGLTSTEGLVVWLDAAAQSAAREAQGLAPLASGDAVEQWFDSSGNGRHLHQADVAMRPTIRLDGKLAALRFNGRNACLSLDSLGLAHEQQPIFIVAAPASNAGNFRALLSMRARGADDFQSGLTVDLGPYPSPDLAVVNVEGAGFGGVNNLRAGGDPFLKFRRLCITSAVGPQSVALYVDGQPEKARPRTESTTRTDELVVGARIYGGDSPRGFFAGEIAEMIIYDRVLSDAERKSVDSYLAAKYDAAPPIPPIEEAPRPGAIPRVKSPPPVQVHVPGFTVRELPVDLPNVNNLLYREDGALVALGYDGDIHLLTDSDGDGLEDRQSLFWKNEGQLRAPIGMALTPPGYKRGRGVLVAAKSKCVLIVDTDSDDRADEEVIVADGWTELPHGVDALGVAFDPRDHAVYFGLGVTNFTNAYLVEAGGPAGYRLDGERGTILRVAPDFKSREIFATGIRFPVAIRFNGAGDLFCTDQEGATWLANGNPFDELLHVQQGRHYGFPPRHPRHLPEVIDEPSVYDYRPQHQCTCGLNFNEPATDGTQFGPDWWKSDALVTGYSRGKLYRTKLAQTLAGYVAQNQLLATMSTMPADACVGPRRSLVIAAHSGGPDWGSGPSGQGKLLKVTYKDRDAPIPSLVWAEGPREVRIAFDRPVNPEDLKNVAAAAAIEGGEFAVAGDRFETVRPGYASVEHQQNAPRFGVEVLGAQLTADRRTLILTTAPHFAAVSYAVALPGAAPKTSSAESSSALPQLPDVDLQYDLTGVEAMWQRSDAQNQWSGWLPHLDLNVALEFTQASAGHATLWKGLRERGVLTLKAALDLQNMLRPAVQIGSTIDYQWPAETVTLTFTSSDRIEVTLDGQEFAAKENANGAWTVECEVEDPKQEPYPIEVRVHHETANRLPSLTAHWHTSEDSRARSLPLVRLLLPWARRSSEPPALIDNRDLPELAGGDWLRGRQEFLGSEAGCSKCHAVRGEGGAIGPDLSNLTKRDYASVLRDVTQPSFAINPDHVTQVVLLATGRVLTGTVRTDAEQLIVSDQEGKTTIVPREDVEDIQASELSIMPEGIPKTLGPDRLRDLLTFLLVEPPSMPIYGELQPPLPRSMEEVNAVLADAEKSNSKKRLHVVLVAGPKDHGPGEHDYPTWQTAWERLLSMAQNVRITKANPWPSEEALKSADVLVFYQQGAWTPERARDLDRFLRRGGGAVYIHYAVDGGTDPAGFAERIGLAWQGGRSKFRHGPLDVEFTADAAHPIARNFDRVHFHDESYWNLVGNPRDVKLLASGVEEDQPQPLFWTLEPHGGRVFVSIPGHFSWTFDDPLFRILLLRGIAWAGKDSVDRFNDLVLPGARVATGAKDAELQPQTDE